jgi:hypothetical protein
MRSTCSAHLYILNFIVLITFGEDYKLRSSSHNSLEPSTISSLLSSNILLNTLFSNTFRLYSSLNVGNRVSRLRREVKEWAHNNFAECLLPFSEELWASRPLSRSVNMKTEKTIFTYPFMWV